MSRADPVPPGGWGHHHLEPVTGGFNADSAPPTMVAAAILHRYAGVSPLSERERDLAAHAARVATGPDGRACAMLAPAADRLRRALLAPAAPQPSLIAPGEEAQP